ncbi:hypothetical protein FRC09_020656, partial [Ceratobasidium sp. 395]
MDTDFNSHDEPFRRWKIAQNDFSRALSDFQASSIDFCNVLSSSAAYSFSRSSLEKTLSALDLELSSLEADEERLRTTRATLTIERNKSKTLSPIHSLPSELLATIFSNSIAQYTRYDRSRAIKLKHASPTTISGVCSLWRRTALETPLLWSHIDITVGERWKPRFEQARLWSQRSRNLLLYVAVRDFPPGESHSRSGVQAGIRALIEFLAPLMSRVRVLDIWLVADSHNMVLSLIKCWIENALQVPWKILQLRNILHRRKPAIELSPDTVGSISPEGFNAFFDTVSRVSLLNCRFPVPVVFSAALVELHLEQLYGPHTPSQQHLATMLAASPRLRILVLSDCCIQPSEGTPNPVILNHLQSLSLEHTGEPGHSGFECVFPLLGIGSETLDMSLTLDDDPDFVIKAESFFSRTRVTRLFVRDI